MTAGKLLDPPWSRASPNGAGNIPVDQLSDCWSRVTEDIQSFEFDPLCLAQLHQAEKIHMPDSFLRGISP